MGIEKHKLLSKQQIILGWAMDFVLKKALMKKSFCVHKENISIVLHTQGFVYILDF